ncbi:PREDICTED: uncharacterized protein LOC103321373 [Prunus mume]|uniref:Uncharacterized protein LOC103321373 n=1 Tax=Prunus mume TaxID=102107 RepID=A0ABM0N9D0_PRUMU|nr:PREDICTED: uncharacterized protein LOC103321373 [Prunus mume]
MPLLDIIGVSSFNTSFYSCFVFMQKEEEKDYVWALEMFNKILGVHNQPLVIISDRELALMNAIRIVFPSACNLLCVWHIEKNILANCKPHFREEVDWVAFLSTWADLIKSPNESSFDKAWDHFENEYKENAAVLNYIRGTWLPLKEKFVSAWTDEVAHLGNRATSRAEDELYKQHEAAKYGNLSSQCTGHFFKTMGIPCGHMIKDMKIQVLPLNAIHNQWRMDARLFNNDQHGSLDDENDQINSLLLDFKEKYEKLPILKKDDTKRQLSQFVGTSFPLIMEPKIQPHKGRPLGSKKRNESSSTRREPSKFEIVEKSRKCSVCKGVGHNKSTCPFQVAS